MIDWVEVSAVDVVPGDTVKVAEAAYKTKATAIHNGRICKVVKVESGDVVVASIDGKLPYLKGTRHAPHVLRKMVLHESIS